MRQLYFPLWQYYPLYICHILHFHTVCIYTFKVVYLYQYFQYIQWQCESMKQNHVFLTTQSKRTRCLWWLTEGDIVPWYFWSYDQQFHPVCHAVHLFVFMQAVRLQRDGGAALLLQYPAGLWSWANTVLFTQNESEEWERDKQILRAWRVKTLLWRKPQ